MKTDQHPLRWQWYSAWSVLIVSLVLVLTGVTTTISGIFDPPRAGPLQWHVDALPTWTLTAGTQSSQIPGIHSILAPPFTLEISAILSADSDPAGQWQVSIQGIDSLDSIGVDGSGNFWHTQADQRIPFSHLRPPGQANRLTIDVDKSGHETIRFNQEIAWQGRYSLADQPGRLRLSGSGGWQTGIQITWLEIALYAP